MMRISLGVVTVLLALQAAIPAPARAQEPVPSGLPLFTYRDALLAGVIVGGTILVRPLDDDLADGIQDSATQANRKLQLLSGVLSYTAAQGAVMIGAGMYTVGRLTKNDRMAQLGLRGSEALLVGQVFGVVLKGVVGRQRPYVEPRNSGSYGFLRGIRGGDQFRSFPSGHALAAFAVAAAVTSETAAWWPDATWVIAPAMYGGAAMVGASRMYDNRHWASDVIFGGGIGTFAGLKVVRYHRAHPGTGFDRWLLRGSISPTNDGGRAFRWSVLPDLSPRMTR